MRIALGSDHAGFELKSLVAGHLIGLGHRRIGLLGNRTATTTRRPTSSASRRAISRMAVVLPTPGLPSSSTDAGRLKEEEEEEEDGDGERPETRSAAASAEPRTARPTRHVRPTTLPSLLRSAETRCSVRSTPALLSSPNSPTEAQAASRSSLVTRRGDSGTSPTGPGRRASGCLPRSMTTSITASRSGLEARAAATGGGSRATRRITSSLAASVGGGSEAAEEGEEEEAGVEVEAEAASLSEEEEELASPFDGEPLLPPNSTPSLGGGAAAAVDSARCDSRRERRPVGGRARSGVAVAVVVDGGVEGEVEADRGVEGGAPSFSSPSLSSSSSPSLSWEAVERSAGDAEEAEARTRSWRRGRGRRTTAATADETNTAATGVATPHLFAAADGDARLLAAASPLLDLLPSTWHRDDLICTARIESEVQGECKRGPAARNKFVKHDDEAKREQNQEKVDPFFFN